MRQSNKLSGEYLKCLREQIQKAYTLATNGLTLTLSQTRGNEDYENLRQAIIDTLKIKITDKIQPPLEDTLINFFYAEEVAILSPSLQMFIKFIHAFGLSCAEHAPISFSEKEHQTSIFSGADQIDADFKHSIEENATFTPTEFFCSKVDEKCQWYGIIKNWDVRRKSYGKLLKSIQKCFEKKNNCELAAVVHGSGGSGKSTMLRRLAIDCIECDFITLWITRVPLFFTAEWEKIVKNKKCKFLIIIEDWEMSESCNRDFITSIIKHDHVRVVIGDRYIDDKEYLDYFSQDKSYHLLPQENPSIIKKILFINKKWKKISKNVFLNTSLYDSSLFTILFVIAKSHSSKKSNISFTESFLSQFQGIVRSELILIFQSEYHGLAKALYYWAHLFKLYELPIQWHIFLRIADFYNGDQKISSHFAKFDTGNFFGEILSHYIYLEPLVYRWGTKGQLLFFHHDLLIEDGICQKITKELFFNDNIQIEILDFLLKEGNREFGTFLFDAMSYFKCLDDRQTKYYESLADIERMYQNDLRIHYDFKSVCSAAGKVEYEGYWERQITNIALVAFGSGGDSFRYILEYLINKGCKSKTIKEAYDRSLVEDIDDLTFEYTGRNVVDPDPELFVKLLIGNSGD